MGLTWFAALLIRVKPKKTMSEYICPHCKNPIHDDEALLCLYCGESLNRPGKRIPGSRLIFILIALVLLASFILSLLMR